MIRNFILIVAVLSIIGCATIVSKSQWPVKVSSKPDGANITIIDNYGQTVYSGKTPSNVTLNSGAGYFKKAIYTIKYEKDGCEVKTYELSADTNGWYYGNILLLGPGWVFGFFVIDPLTGAMYKLPEEASISLDSDR
ncbi:MAG: hypothetical protein WA124_02105 [Smithella sp.]|jgi:hypothetical protein